MTIFGGVLIYLSLIGAAVGAASLLKPVRFLGMRSRKKGLLVLGLGLLGFTAGVYLPVAETRVETLRTRLDEFAPIFQFSEFHRIPISAPKDRVYSAIRTVTPEEILFYRTVTWIRGAGKRSPAGNLNAPEARPILETFTSGAFLPLAEDPDREIVFGRAGDGRGEWQLTAEKFKALHRAPLLKIVMNFRIQKGRHPLFAHDGNPGLCGRPAGPAGVRHVLADDLSRKRVDPAHVVARNQVTGGGGAGCRPGFRRGAAASSEAGRQRHIAARAARPLSRAVA